MNDTELMLELDDVIGNKWNFPFYVTPSEVKRYLPPGEDTEDFVADYGDAF